MSTWGIDNGVIREYGGIITTARMIGAQSSIAASSVAWNSANYAVYVPLLLATSVTVYKITMGDGTLTGGNFDVGIYNSIGTKLVSSGATARAGASQEQVIDITDTVIGPGLYYVAMSADGTNNYIMINSTNTQLTRMCGVLGQASAYTLPATATFAAASQSRIPALALHVRSY